MFVRLGQHLRCNFIAYLALFVALGGTSFAAASKWTGEDILDGSITTADVRDQGLTGADVSDESIQLSDLHPSARSSIRTYFAEESQVVSLDGPNSTLSTGPTLTISLGTADVVEVRALAEGQLLGDSDGGAGARGIAYVLAEAPGADSDSVHLGSYGMGDWSQPHAEAEDAKQWQTLRNVGEGVYTFRFTMSEQEPDGLSGSRAFSTRNRRLWIRVTKPSN